MATWVCPRAAAGQTLLGAPAWHCSHRNHNLHTLNAILA